MHYASIYLYADTIYIYSRWYILFGTWLGMIRITWGKSPEWLYRNLRFSKRATVGVLYSQPMLPGETPVWSESSVDERNLYSTRSAIIGLAVETWRVKTELIIITILHIIIITTSILNLGFKTIAPKILAHTKCINKYWKYTQIFAATKIKQKIIAKVIKILALA